MDLRTLKSVAKRVALCNCNSCLLQRAKEMLQQQESPDLLLGVAVRIAEDLKSSGSGTIQSAFPHWEDPNLSLSGRPSGSATAAANHLYISYDDMCSCGVMACINAREPYEINEEG